MAIEGRLGIYRQIYLRLRACAIREEAHPRTQNDAGAKRARNIWPASSLYNRPFHL